ncbi:MAG: N-acetylneuraminate lyase [Bryobacteraceae bacterium]|nr:MAG: N-acetylneuraminate lyase [Bryobacteraceae bacterium]
MKLEGILPALVTPFSEEVNLDEAALERLLDYVYRGGVDGVYICGQTGEGLQQSPDLRKRVAEAAVRYSPAGKRIVVHVGAPSTHTAVELARHAAAVGATAISSLPPAGAYSFAEIRDYYKELAAATDLPCLVYHYPAISGTVSSLDQVTALCSLPNVIGLKFTDMDLYKLASLKKAGCNVLNGYDEILVAGLLMGADGGIGSFYNVAPHLFVELYCAARRGDWARAKAVQDDINEIITIGLRYPVHSAVKAMLAWLGLDCGQCLGPRRPLTAVEVRELHELLERSPLAAARTTAGRV